MLIAGISLQLFRPVDVCRAETLASIIAAIIPGHRLTQYKLDTLIAVHSAFLWISCM